MKGFSYLLSLILLSTILSCNKEEEEVVPQIPELPDISVIDISQDYSPWNYLVLGKEDYFFVSTLQNPPSQIPREILFYSSEAEKSYYISLNEEGILDKVVVDDHIFVFRNFNGNYVDIGIVYPDGKIDTLEQVKTDYDWDNLSIKNARVKDVWTVVIRNAARVAAGVPCLVSVASAIGTSGALAPFAFWRCGNFLLNLGVDIATNEFGIHNNLTDFLEIYGAASTLISCNSALAGNANTALDCASGVISSSLHKLADDREKVEKSKENIIEIENRLTFSAPSVTTSIATDITETSATVGGNVTSNGRESVTERGIYWGTSTNAETTGTKITIGNGVGEFSTSLDLMSNTTYFVKSFALNSIGIAYGGEVSFTTNIGLPIVQTIEIKDVTDVSALAVGKVEHDGGDDLTERGFVYSTSSNPDIFDSVEKAFGIAVAEFSATLENLNPDTKYYVRAYATNSTKVGYGIEIAFTTGQSTTITDIEGNTYNTVTIGTQEWMAENLKTTKYNDGTAITLVTDGTSWGNLSTEAYCYSDQAAYVDTYGALYNWYSVDTGKLCPASWHVPSDEEWTTLVTYLGGKSVAGGKMKETGTTHWNSPNSGATNESGFTGLPGGMRYIDGDFYGIAYHGYWWSSTEDGDGTYDAWLWKLRYDYVRAFRYDYDMKEGYSIRCVRD